MIRLTLLVSALLSATAFAQEVLSISGTVTGNTTEFPAFVVAVGDATDPNIILEAVVNADGSYAIEGLAEGAYSVLADVYSPSGALLLTGEHPTLVSVGPSAGNVDIELVPVETPPPALVGEVVYHGGPGGPVTVTLGNHSLTLAAAPYVFEFAEIAAGPYPLHAIMDANGDGVWEPGEPAGEITVSVPAAAVTLVLHDTPDAYEPDNSPEAAKDLVSGHPQFHTFHLPPDPLVRTDAAPDIDHLKFVAGPGNAEFATHDLRGGILPLLTLRDEVGNVLAEAHGGFTHSFADNTRAILSIRPDPNGAPTGSYIIDSQFAAPVEHIVIAGQVAFAHIPPQAAAITAVEENGLAFTAIAEPNAPFAMQVPAGTYALTATLLDGSMTVDHEPVTVPPSTDAIVFLFQGDAPIAQDAFEPDNDLATAKEIASGEVQARTIHGPDPANLADVDHISFYAFSGPCHPFFDSDLPLDLALFDAAGNELPMIATSPVDREIAIDPYWWIEVAGDYTLRIAAAIAGDTGHYGLKLEYRDEPYVLAGFVEFEHVMPADAFVIATGTDGDIYEVLAAVTPNNVAPFRLEVPAGTYTVSALVGTETVALPEPVHVPPSKEGLILVFEGEEPIGPDAYEPDNSVGQAKPITKLEVQEHTIHQGDLQVIDVDHVVFHAFPGVAAIHHLETSDDLVLGFTLTDANGNQIQPILTEPARESPPIDIRPIWEIPAEGDFVLRIDPVAGVAEGEYAISLDFADSATLGPDTYEPDNAPEQASHIESGEVQERSIHPGNLAVLDVDFIVFHAFHGPVHPFFESDIPLLLTLIDSAGNELPQIVSDAAREDTTIPIEPFWWIEAAGDYFLRVEAAHAGDTGAYALKLDYNDEPLFIAGRVEGGSAATVVRAENSDGTVVEGETDGGEFFLEVPPGSYRVTAQDGNALAEYANTVVVPPSKEEIVFGFGPRDCTVALPVREVTVTAAELANLMPIPLPANLPFVYNLSITNSGGFSGGPLGNPWRYQLCLGTPPLAIAAAAEGVAPHVALIGPDPNNMLPLAPGHQDLTGVIGDRLHLFAETDGQLENGIVHFDIWFAALAPVPELNAEGFAQNVDYVRYVVGEDPTIAGHVAFDGRQPQPLLVQALQNGVVVAEIAIQPDNNTATAAGIPFRLQVPAGEYHIQAVIGEETAEFANNPVVVPPSVDDVWLVFGPEPVEPDQHEPNNTAATATQIGNGELQEHSIHLDPAGVLDVDHLVFHAFLGDVWAHLDTTDGLHLGMSLFDAAGNELPMIFAEPVREDFPFPHPLWQIQAEGDYTLRLAPIAGASGTGHYQIELEFADSAIATIAGVVTGVQEASVLVFDAFTDGPPLAQLSTGPNGEFETEVRAPGSYVLEAIAGNETVTATVQVPPDALNIELAFTPSPVPLLIGVDPVVTEAPVNFHLIFERPVQGLAAADLTVANGSVTDLQPLNSGFLVVVDPFGPGPVTLTVPAGAAADANGVPSAGATASTLFLPEVGCDALPPWDPPVGVQNTMTVHVQLYAKGQLIDAPGSLVAAFKGNEIRGVAEIAEGPAGPWFQLSVGSNAVQETGLTLAVFNADNCDICHSHGSFDFVADTTLGAIDDPLQQNACETVQEIDLVAGWNWVSFNVSPEDPSLDAALAFDPLPSDHTEIKTAPHQRSVATYFDGSWFGLPNGIACGARYLINSDAARTLTVVGQPCGGAIPIVAGWNWIGYNPQEALPVNVALANFAASNGDELKTSPDKGGTWTYFDGQWFGPDVPMRPGVGYLLRSATAGELVYNADPNNGEPIITPLPNVSRAAPDWTPPVGVQGTMTVHASVDGISQLGSKLAAFKDGEIRGVADLFVGPAGPQFILAVGSNLAAEPGITFAAYDAATDSICDISQGIDFAVDTTVGLINDTLPLTCEVVEPLSIVDVQPSPLVIDENGTGTVGLTVENAAGDLTWSISSAPGNGTATVTEGLATYAPFANFGGSDEFTVLVSDGLRSDSATVLVEVREVPDAPTLSHSPNPVIVEEDGVITITVNATGEGLTWTNTQPGNGSFQPQILRVAIFNPGQRTYAYAPHANYHGDDSFAVTVVNDGGTATIEIPITIEPVNDPPANAEAPSISGDRVVGASLTANPGTWNDDADSATGPISFAYQWQTFTDGETDIPDAIDNVFEVPEALAGEQLRVVVTASDEGGASAVAESAWIEIAPLVVPDLVPTPAANANITLVEGNGSQTFSVAVAIARDAVQWTVDGEVAGEGASFTYAPDHDTVAHPARSRTVDITASVGGASVTWTNVSVSDVDRLPPLPTIAILPGTPLTTDSLTVEILEQGDDPDGDAIIGYAVDWVLLGNARQAFTGMVLAASETQKHNLWEASARPLTNPHNEVVTATVEASTATALVENSVPEAAVIDTVRTGKDAPVDISLGGSDADLLDTLSFIIDDQPDNGSLILTGDVVTYTPHPGFVGEDSFSYAVSDGEAQSPSAIVDVVTIGWLFDLAFTESQVDSLEIGMSGLASAIVAAPGSQGIATGGLEGDQLLSRDVREISEEADWILSVDASDASEEVVISWNTDSVPELGLFLEEIDGELALDMRSINQITVAPGEVRRFSIHYGVVEFTFGLRPGWNIISVPLLPLDTSVEAVLGDVASVFEWWSHAANAREDDPTGEFIPAQEIVPKKGYFVLSNEAREVTIRGSIVSDTITPLQQHWTLFGVTSAPPFKPRHPAEALDPGDLEIRSHIWRWNGKRYRRALRLHAGVGYWVFSDFPITILPFREAAPGQ